MADGTIRVGTKLDMSGLKKDIKELERELNNVRKEQAKVDAQADAVKYKYEERKEFDSQFPAEFSHREQIDKEMAAELDPIIKKQDELNQKEQEYAARLEQANAKLQQQQAIQQASKELDDSIKANSVLDKIKTQEQYNSLLEQTRAKMASIEAQADRIAASNGVSKESILAANPAYQKLADTLGVLTSTTRQFEKASDKAGKTAEKSLRRAKKEADGFGNAIMGGIKKVGKLALAVFGIRGAYRAVRVAVMEYLATNEQLAGQIDAMKSLFGQVLGPAIEWVVNLLMQAVAAVNQFVYALSGINFVAKANAAALKKQEDATKSSSSGSGSGNSTAGFDEQTKLAATSSGGGGGAGGGTSGVYTLPDGSTMDLSFFEPAINALKKFREDIQPIVDTVGKALRWLLDEVLKPLGEWGVNVLFPAALGLIAAALNAFNTVLLGLQPIWQWFWDNILKPIAEWTGQALIDCINWLTDALNAFSDWVKEHQVLVEDIVIVIGSFAAAWLLVTTAMNAWNIAVGLWNVIGVIATAVTTGFGAAVAFLTSPVTLIILAIGALIAIVVLLVKHWDEVKAFATKCWEGIKEAWNKACDWFNEKVIKPIVEFFKKMWEGLKDGAKKAWDGIKNAWEKTKEWFNEKVIQPVANFFKDMWNGLKNGATNAWSNIKSAFSSVGSFFTNIWNTIKSTFTSIGTTIGNAIGGAFKTVVNAIISFAENTINGFIRSINLAIGLINKIPGVNIRTLSLLSIPKLAKGGIVNNPGRGVPAIIGEAGKEAVLPLENNTEWMDILADKIGGNVTIPIYLGGKKIAEYVVDLQKKRAFAMNGA